MLQFIIQDIQKIKKSTIGNIEVFDWSEPDCAEKFA